MTKGFSEPAELAKDRRHGRLMWRLMCVVRDEINPASASVGDSIWRVRDALMQMLSYVFLRRVRATA